MQPPLDGEPPLLGLSSGLDPEGVRTWMEQIEERMEAASSSGQLSDRRSRQEKAALDALLDREILMRMKSKPEFDQAWKQLQSESHRTQSAAFDAIRRMLDRLD